MTTSKLSKAIKMDDPVYFFREQPKPVELLVISARHCPEPQSASEFLVGRFFGGDQGYYYKTLIEAGRILEAVHSFPDPNNYGQTAYEVIAPTAQAGTLPVYPKNVQDDFDALIAIVIAKWGR